MIVCVFVVAAPAVVSAGQVQLQFAGQNLLRARLIALSPSIDPAEVARFHADSAILERAFQRSATGVLEAYPGMSWPVDSLFGYRSLQIHDALYGTQGPAFIAIKVSNKRYPMSIRLRDGAHIKNRFRENLLGQKAFD